MPDQEAPQGQQDQGQAPKAEPEKKVVVRAHERAKKREQTFEKRQQAAAKKSAKGEPEAKTEPPKAPAQSAEPSTALAIVDASSAELAKPAVSDADIAKRYAIAERRLGKLKQKETQLSQREQTLTRAESRLASVFGEPHAVKEAYAKGEYHVAAQALQRWLGDDFATVTQKIARATAGLSPERLKELEERDNLRRRNAELERDRQERENRGKAETTRAQALTTVAAKAAGHLALKVRGGAELVLQELERSWDDTTKGFRLTIQQAADRVVEQRRDDAEAIGLRATPAPPPAAAPPPTRTPPPAAKPSTEAARGKQRLSFEERQALAARITARQRVQ